MIELGAYTKRRSYSIEKPSGKRQFYKSLRVALRTGVVTIMASRSVARRTKVIQGHIASGNEKHQHVHASTASTYAENNERMVLGLALCDSSIPDPTSKVITADQAAALVPDGTTVRMMRSYRCSCIVREANPGTYCHIHYDGRSCPVRHFPNNPCGLCCSFRRSKPHTVDVGVKRNLRWHAIKVVRMSISEIRLVFWCHVLRNTHFYPMYFPKCVL